MWCALTAVCSPLWMRMRNVFCWERPPGADPGCAGGASSPGNPPPPKKPEVSPVPAKASCEDNYM